MNYYEIKFYDSDHGGMHNDLKRVEYFVGDAAKMEAFVEQFKSPWGGKYTLVEYSPAYKRHKHAYYKELSAEVYEALQAYNEAEQTLRDLEYEF